MTASAETPQKRPQRTAPAAAGARAVARHVLEVEAAAVRAVIRQLDAGFERAVTLIDGCRGRVVCTGMGKSGIIMRKVAATLSSTGTPSLFLHPAEAIHGDLGMVVAGDVVLAASYSGTTEELQRLAALLGRLAVPLVMITGHAASPLARVADIHLPVAIDREACPLGLAPTASTTATLALGDALAMAISAARGFTAEDFARLHPGGTLGRKLLRIAEVMHRDAELPQVAPTASMPETIHEMSRKGLGITAIVDREERLLGCLSDGDLRRALEADPGLMQRTAGAVMRPGAKTIEPDALASAALARMEAHHITSLFVRRPEGRLEGIVHIHDLWRLELF